MIKSLILNQYVGGSFGFFILSEADLIRICFSISDKELLKSFSALIKKGHSIVVIEHNIELIKCADYIIDLGPGGGENGGQLLAEGTPEEVVKSKKSYTASYLKEKLK